MMYRSLAAAVLVTGLLAGPGLSFAPAAQAATLASTEGATTVQERRERGSGDRREGRREARRERGGEQRAERGRGGRGEARQERPRREERAASRPDRGAQARPDRRQNAGADIRQDRRRDAVQNRGPQQRVDRGAGQRGDARVGRRDQRVDQRVDRRDQRPDQRFGHRDQRRDQRFDRRDQRPDPRFSRRDQRPDPRFRGHRPAPRVHNPPRRVYSHAPARANWHYNRRYTDRYSRNSFRYDQRFCRSNGDGLVAGALIGAILGGAAYDGDGGAVLAGGLLGAGLGSSFNDCDRGQYRYAVHSAFSNDRPYYWNNPYSGVRGVVYARDWHQYGGLQCRWGDAEIFLPNGEVSYDRVRMCRDRYGRWEVARRQ